MPRKPSNTFGARAKPFIDRLEVIEKDLEVAYQDYVEVKKDAQEDRKSILKEANDAGVLPRVLKDFQKKRKLKSRIAAIGKKHDPDEAAQFRQLELELDEPDDPARPLPVDPDHVLETLSS
jgi:hypothetical protein